MRKYMVRALCGSVLLGIIALSAGLSSHGWGWGNETVSAQAAVQPVAVTGNLSSPLYVTHARDGSGRLFIVEQAGRVLVLPAEATSPLATPFLDIGPKLLAGGERGLLGLAFHPFYRDNRRFFVNYTRAGDGATVISEFSASVSDPDLAETTEKILLTIPQPFANHNGGMIEFGYDGYLYIGMGDGGSSFDPGNRAQNLDELLGKFLRIDVDHPNGAAPYSSPASNPFFGDTPGRDEIYALGLRNPFRWSFDRASGNLYAGDVGQNAVEEIDIVTRGANLGWRIFEGTQCTNVDPRCDMPGLTPPIAEYTHTGGRCSVTGGYVYRGQRSTFPSGTYIFGDFCTGEIFTYYNNTMSLLIDTDLQLSSFGEDELGEIYAVGLDGRVFRLTGPAPPATSVSAASYRGGVFAAESIITAFGLNFSTATETAPIGQPLPTVLAGASVRVTDATGTDRPAPLYYVSPGQLNYQIPAGTAAGNATVTINTSSGAQIAATVGIADVSPGIFTLNGSGSGLPAAFVLRQRADGSQSYEPIARFDSDLNQYQAIPIDLGLDTDQVYLSVLGTGVRSRSSLPAVSALVGGASANVVYAGPQSASNGPDQVNLLLPRSLAGRGEVALNLMVDGRLANTVRINIK